MTRCVLLLTFMVLSTSLFSQLKLCLAENDITLNNYAIINLPSKSTLDSIVGERSKYAYIIGSLDPSTGNRIDIKRNDYRFKKSGFRVDYYAKEKTIYSISLVFREMSRKVSKMPLLSYNNNFQHGPIFIDSTITLNKAIEMIGKDKIIASGEKLYFNKSIPYLLYTRYNMLIELYFLPTSKLITAIHIRR